MVKTMELVDGNGASGDWRAPDPPAPQEAVLAKMRAEFPLSRSKSPPARLVIAFAAAEFGVMPAAITSRCRLPRFVRPRHVACYLLHTMTSRSLQNIGRAVGGRDHSAALRAARKIAALAAADAEFAARLAALRRRIEEAFAPFLAREASGGHGAPQ